MWTSIHLSVQMIWDEAHWYATATWADDPTTQPVTLTKSGLTRIHPESGPQERLQRVLVDLADSSPDDDWRL